MLNPERFPTVGGKSGKEHRFYRFVASGTGFPHNPLNTQEPFSNDATPAPNQQSNTGSNRISERLSADCVAVSTGPQRFTDEEWYSRGGWQTPVAGRIDRNDYRGHCVATVTGNLKRWLLSKQRSAAAQWSCETWSQDLDR